MNAIDFNDLFVSDISIVSGVRQKGRGVDFRSGRLKHGFLYLLSGEATFYLPGKTLRVKTGELLYIPKGLAYKMQYSQPDTTFIVVNFDMFDRNSNSLSLYESIHLVALGDSAHNVSHTMARLEACATSEAPAMLLRRKELLYQLLSILCSDSHSPLADEGRYPQIAKGVALLKQTYLESLPIETFANESSVSTSSFRALFKKQYGLSPLQYRNRLRINRARQLLIEDGCTVSEAAYASGFDNIGYFCRYYKQVTGETPSETKNSTINF